MPLVDCVDCGAELSSNAVNCPKCGGLNKKAANTQVFAVFGTFFGTFAAIPLLWVLVLWLLGF